MCQTTQRLAARLGPRLCHSHKADHGSREQTRGVTMSCCAVSPESGLGCLKASSGVPCRTSTRRRGRGLIRKSIWTRCGWRPSSWNAILIPTSRAMLCCDLCSGIPSGPFPPTPTTPSQASRKVPVLLSYVRRTVQVVVAQSWVVGGEAVPLVRARFYVHPDATQL